MQYFVTTADEIGALGALGALGAVGALGATGAEGTCRAETTAAKTPAAIQMGAPTATTNARDRSITNHPLSNDHWMVNCA